MFIPATYTLILISFIAIHLDANQTIGAKILKFPFLIYGYTPHMNYQHIIVYIKSKTQHYYIRQSMQKFLNIFRKLCYLNKHY